MLNTATEIMTSEETFVGVLKLLNCDFREAVKEAGGAKIIPEEEERKIFNNLMEMQILNGDLLKDFRESIENWDERRQIADVIVKKGPFLKLYTSYMKDFQSAMEHYSTCCSKYPEFGAVVRKFEARESCKGLKLEHFLLKPVQRLPQYKLLLESYLKHLSPTSEDYKPATEAHSIVSQAAAHANEQIRQDVSSKVDILAVFQLPTLNLLSNSGQFPQVVPTPIPPRRARSHQTKPGANQGGRHLQNQPQRRQLPIPHPLQRLHHLRQKECDWRPEGVTKYTAHCRQSKGTS